LSPGMTLRVRVTGCCRRVATVRHMCPRRRLFCLEISAWQEYSVVTGDGAVSGSRLSDLLMSGQLAGARRRPRTGARREWARVTQEYRTARTSQRRSRGRPRIGSGATLCTGATRTLARYRAAGSRGLSTQVSCPPGTPTGVSPCTPAGASPGTSPGTSPGILPWTPSGTPPGTGVRRYGQPNEGWSL
jgi:hypothetical protein